MSLSCDVLIIGTGIAGLTAAIKLSEEKNHVLLVTRAKSPEETNTFYAQGGISYPVGDKDLYLEDINRASAFTTSGASARQLVELSGKIVDEILINKAKTNFEKDDQGELKFTKEAAHSISRILYRGDYTGREVEISLLNYIRANCSNVEILTAHTAIDLITPQHHGVSIQQRYEESCVLGAYVLNQDTEKVVKILAKYTILATGGIGALYLHHTNSEGARGDGLAMAKRAGATITDMEFIQFHPTAFYDHSSDRRFLISEALRGEGGILLDKDGNRFMKKYHPDLELAPRDVVSRAIWDEMLFSKHNYVYLDISHQDANWIKQRFPTIFSFCLEKKLDITKSPIPVVPAAHYTCGGVKVDLQGKTSLNRLYAVGEVSCTGLHGANRLASNSLLEGLTWGHMAAEDILKNINNITNYEHTKIKNWELATGHYDSALIAQDWYTLKITMWNYLGLRRSANQLMRARAMLVELSEEIQRFYRHTKLRDDLIGLRNGVEVAQMVLNASLRNKESVGCFFRQDNLDEL